MGMRKRGQIFSSVVVALILFMIGMICINFLQPEVLSARTGLACSSAATISDGTKLMCLGIDVVVPYFIILVLSITGGIITEKLLI